MRIGKRARRMMLACGLPEDAAVGGARVTLYGRAAVMVVGQRGVVEMSDNCIRLKTDSGVLAICGQELRLQELSLDAAMVYGADILSVGYGRA